MMATLLVVMGVSGSGKSTVGIELARQLGVEFLDGDDAHSKENIEKMRSGVPLTDQDRVPWLLRLREQAVNLIETSRQQSLTNPAVLKLPMAVIACSALKRGYRDILRGTSLDGRPAKVAKVASSFPTDLKTCFIYLKGTTDLLERRMQRRQNHFMGVEMLESQLGTLEEPNAKTEDSMPSSIITIYLDGPDDRQERNLPEVVEDILAQLDSNGYLPASAKSSATTAPDSLPPIAKVVGSTSDPKCARATLSLLFEVSDSIERRLIPLLQGQEPPSSNYEALVSLCHHLVQHKFSIEEKVSFLGSHPRIGEVKGLSRMSSKEQKNHKPTDPKVLRELERLNQVYESVYPGLRYVTFVNGRDRAEILHEMRNKLYGNNNPSGSPAKHERDEEWFNELSRGIDDTFQIAQSRLQTLTVITEDLNVKGSAEGQLMA